MDKKDNDLEEQLKEKLLEMAGIFSESDITNLVLASSLLIIAQKLEQKNEILKDIYESLSDTNDYLYDISQSLKNSKQNSQKDFFSEDADAVKTLNDLVDYFSIIPKHKQSTEKEQAGENAGLKLNKNLDDTLNDYIPDYTISFTLNTDKGEGVKIQATQVTMDKFLDFLEKNGINKDDKMQNDEKQTIDNAESKEKQTKSNDQNKKQDSEQKVFTDPNYELFTQQWFYFINKFIKFNIKFEINLIKNRNI